jgi:hypothetical protein
VQLAAGDEKHALATAARLDSDVSPEARAFGKLLHGEAALLRGRNAEALAGVRDALATVDMWQAHLLAARAQLAEKHFAEAKAELDTCIARRGEVADSLTDMPGLRHVPPLFYYRALAEDGLGDHVAAAKDLEAFLAWRAHGEPDALVADARKRLGQ